MKRIRFYWPGYLLFIGAMLKVLSVQAQNAELSRFAPMLQEAIGYNKSLYQQELSSEKTKIDRQAVKGKRLPSLSLSAGYGFFSTSIDLDLPEQVLPGTDLSIFSGSQGSRLSSQLAFSGLTAKQIIYAGGQISLGQEALMEKHQAERLLTEANYEEIGAELVVNFDRLMLLDLADSLIRSSELRLDKTYQKVLKGIENGLAIPYDRDKLKLALLELQSKKVELASQRELLGMQLQEITGMPLDSLTTVHYQLQEILLNENQKQTISRKEVDALNASQRAYDLLVKKEKGAKLPQLLAFGNLSYFNAFDSRFKLKDLGILGSPTLRSNHLQLAPNYAVGIALRWNLFDGQSARAAISKAKLDQQINASKLADTQEKLQLLNHKNQADYRLASAQLNVRRQQVKIAQNNVYLAERQYQEGLIDVTERLKAENELLENELNYYKQIAEQRLSAVQLLKDNGQLYQSIIQ